MNDLEAIKIEAVKIKAKEQSARDYLAEIEREFEKRFLAAMELAYKITVGSTVEWHGKQFQVSQIQLFLMDDPRTWGNRKPCIKGRIIRKNGTAGKNSLCLFDEWSILG